MNKVVLGIAAIVVLLGSLGWYEGNHHKASAAPVVDDGLPSCVAGENEICAPKNWMDAYEKWIKLGKALNDGIPGGYAFNNSSKFIKNVTKVEPAPAKKK